MWLMLQQPNPDDYVIASGATHTVREFVNAAFSYAGLDYQAYVTVDPRFFRIAEVNALSGDPQKANKRLGWRAETNLREIVEEMVAADCKALGVSLPADCAPVAMSRTSS
jgi:GDPmannose 4,6-dehydratase